MRLSLHSAARFILENLRKHPQETPATPAATPSAPIPAAMKLTAAPQISRLPTGMRAEIIDN